MSSVSQSRRPPAATLLATARRVNRGDVALSRARRVLATYEDVAEGFERAGQVEDAVAAVTLGATMASFRHPGVHVSLRLESVLARLGAAGLRPLPPRGATTGRVLHIATETYAVGGHTRMIWRWVTRDRDRAHVLATTSQRGEMPAGLVAALDGSGGEVVAIDPNAPALARAQSLRDVAATVDVIVLHQHPMDPIPTLAFADAANRPPMVTFNHADHVFWLGASIADVLQSIRSVGQGIAAARGVAPERRVLTTAPVAGGDGNGLADRRARDRERAAVLEQFGWPSDSVVLFSAASPDKFQGTEGLTLLDLVDPVLRGAPRARLLIAGAAEDETWRFARKRHAGRVVAVGPQASLAALFASSDVYLESQPFGGPGASSEAAAFGLPVLTHAATERESLLFCTDPRYGSTVAVGPGEYRRELARLIGDPEHRAAVGEHARATIAASDAAWDEAVELVYRRAAELGPVALAELVPQDAGDEDLDLLVDQCLMSTHRSVDASRVTAMAETIAFVASSPPLRGLWDELNSIGGAPARRFPLVVALPPADAGALRAVIAEFLRLQALGIADRFAIGLRPDQADAAIPVLEDALGEHKITIDVAVDPGVESIVRPDALEVVVPGQAGTGVAAVHVCAPVAHAAPTPERPAGPPRRSKRGKRR